MSQQINSFSKEVLDELKSYVYRLIDPRDGTTFYVGKGKGNRLFAHVNGALENYQGVDYLSDEEKDNYSNLKIKRIREIHDDGLEVIHVIQRWGLTDEQAFLVEATLIDVYGMEHLSNRVKGKDREHGVCNAETLEMKYHCPYFEDSPEFPAYIIIKVKNWWINERGNDRYEATRSAWHIAKWRTNPKVYPYVLSVTNGIVREVYEVKYWQEAGRDGRKEFVGCVAPEDIRNLFVRKRIPECYSKKGVQSPVLFSKIYNEKK